jgi:hypothetical protein
MNAKKYQKIPGAALVLLLLLSSCTNFFSTSWGEIFKRDPRKVKVNSSNVYELLKTAKGDKDLSKAILDQIGNQVSSPGISDKDKKTLQHAAIKAANQAADVPSKVLENVGKIIDAANDGGKNIQEVANEILNDIQSNDLIGISEKLTEILKDEMVTANAVASKDALIRTGKIEVAVPPKAESNTPPDTPAKISLDIGGNGKGTATITVIDENGTKTEEKYNCEINEDGKTITLNGAGDSGANVDLNYTIADSDHSLTIENLDKIAIIPENTYATTSDPSKQGVALGKAEFNDGFMDDVPGSDLSLMAMTLVLAKAEKEKGDDGTLDEYLTTWEQKNLDTGKGLDADEVIIVAVVNTMAEKGEDMTDLTKLIKDLLGVNQ